MTLKEKIRYAKVAATSKRTSRSWCQFFGIIQGDIVSPDGWDRKNLHYAFNNESITFINFNNRIHMSTCRGTAKEYCQAVIELTHEGVI